MSTKQLRQTSRVSSRQIIRESWLIQDLVNYMWYTIVSGKELRDMVQMWKICVIDIYYFFKLSPPRREDYADVQQKLNLDEFIFLQHVQSWWLYLIPAIERVRKQFPALKEYFRKLPDSDKNMAVKPVKNSGMQKQCYLGIRTFFTETLTYMQVTGT